MADGTPGTVGVVASLGTAVVTFLVAPAVRRLIDKRRDETDEDIRVESAAVAALRSTLDALQTENHRLRESVDWQDRQIAAARARISELEAQLAAHRSPPSPQKGADI